VTAASTAVGRVSWSTRLQPVIWFVLTIALAVSASRLPWRDTLAAIGGARLQWVMAAVLANWIVLPLWSLEWLLLLPQRGSMTFGRMFSIVAVTAATLNTIPFFVGEATGFALLVASAGLSHGAAASMIAMDQLLVGIGKVLTLAATAAVGPLPPWLRLGVASFVMVVALLAMTLIVLAHWWTVIHRHLSATTSRTRMFLARVVAQGAHLAALRQQQRLVPLLGLAIGKKIAELAAILAVEYALGVPVSPATGLLESFPSRRPISECMKPPYLPVTGQWVLSRARRWPSHSFNTSAFSFRRSRRAT